MPKGKDTSIQIRISSDLKNKWQKNADKEEKTLTQFIIDTMNERTSKDNIIEVIKDTIQKEFEKQK